MNKEVESKKIGYIKYSTTLIPILISITALIISIYTCHRENELAGLYLEPKLVLFSNFKSNEITIRNLGPVTAVQLEIFTISYNYRRVYKAIDYTWSNIAEIKELPTFEEKKLSFHIPTSTPIVDNKEEPHIKAFEIRLVYRRPPDMKLYIRSAYYFLDSNGNWVNETSETVNSSTYNIVKQAIMRESRSADLDIFSLIYDPLHEIR